MALEQYILQGLISRGLPPHVAQGFVMNMQDESRLNPGINEANPIVAGSRGGFGLNQWTGPRRRAYEAFAQSRGVPLDNVDAQLDFTIAELQGPENRAFKKIMATPDAGSAGVSIVQNFLRPAPEHQASRSAKYGKLGGDSMVARNFAPQVSGQVNAPMPGSAPQDGGGGGFFGLPQSPIPASVAAYATDDDKKKSTLGRIGDALAAIPDAPNPLRGGLLGDARASGDALNKALAAPTLADFLFKKRMS